jgi:hemerythrin
MSILQWDESLSVGIELIDEQHKQWIERLNDVDAAIESHRDIHQIANTLEFLVDDTRLHFGTEERRMRENDYPELDDHKAIHEKLRGKLDNLVDDFREEGATDTLGEAICTLLFNWLSNHIKDVDQAFGTFVKEKGILLT